MYNEIGKKIKLLAKIMFYTLAIVPIVGSLIIVDSWNALGIILVLLCPLFAWLSSLGLYGLGEIIDKLCDIEKNTRRDSSTTIDTRTAENNDTQSAPINNERIAKASKLFSDGLITKEEYDAAVLKIQQEEA